MKGLNNVQVIGNAGSEVKTFNNVRTLSVAVNEDYKNKQGETVKQTEWIDVVFFGKLGEIAEKYISKGDKLYIDGKINTQKYVDKEGNNRRSTSVVARNMIMLGGNSRQHKNTNEQPQKRQYNTSNKAPDWDKENDDLPF